MSVGSNVVKITAKTALKGSFLKVVAVCCALVFSFIFTVNVSALLGVVFGDAVAIACAFFLILILVLPMLLGVLRYIWRGIYAKFEKPLSVFYWFSSKELYLKALKFVCTIVFKAVLWLVILNIPSLILTLLSKAFIFELLDLAIPMWTANFSYYSIFLRNISFVLVFFIMLKYYMAPLLFVADDSIDINEAMYTSQIIARKTTIDFLGLVLSYIGWIVLSALILPLPFTLPILLTGYAVHIRFSVAEYNKFADATRGDSVEFNL